MKKVLSLLLAVVMVLSLMPIALAAETATFSAVASKESLEIDEEFTVIFSLNSNESGFGSFQTSLNYDKDVLEFVELATEYNELTDSDVLAGSIIPLATYNTETGAIAFAANKNNTKTGVICTATFKAKAAGSSKISLVVEDFGTIPEGGGLVQITDYTVSSANITVAGDEGPDTPVVPEYEGYTVTMPADKTITAGEYAELAVKVSNANADVYNAYDFTFSYDVEKLEFAGATAADANAEVNAENGVITVRGYGKDKTFETAAVTLKFTAKTTGDAEVKLTAAMVDISANAISKDAPAAQIVDDTAVVTVSGYSVTLGEGLSGSAVAAPSADYTFTATEYANYAYEVTATVNGTPVEVTDNGDGTFTIAGENVTGNIAVTAVLTAKSYIVTITGEDTTGAEEATYNTPYEFTINKQAGYTYSVAVKIGGTNYAGYSAEGNVYTIPGTDITGDIEITVAKTAIPATQVSVTFDGTGAGDAKGNDTANIGEDYIFTVEKAEGYSYEVIAKIGSEAVEVTEADGTYTIAGKAVTGDIVITVTKTSDITVEIGEYLTVDEQAINYVVVSGKIAEGKIAMYDGKAMYWSEKYEAYVYLVIGAADASLVTIGDGEAVSIDYSGNVNDTEVIDINDAQLVYDIYNVKYENFDAVSMYKFLCADVNGDLEVNTLDSAAVVAAIQ